MKRRNPVVSAGILVFVLFLAAAAAYAVLRYMPTSKRADLYEYYQAADGDEAKLVLGTQILEVNGLVRDGQAYLPLAMVNEYLNARYYWDEDNQQVLYATPSTLTRSAAASQPGQDVWLRDGEVFLKMDYVKRFTDLDCYVYSQPARICMQNRFTDLMTVSVKKKTAVRVLGGIKSKVLTEVSEGNTLLFMQDYDDWLQVATWDGYIGYVKASKVTKPSLNSYARSFQEESYNYLKTEEPVNMVWNMVTVPDANDFLEGLTENMTGVNVITPTWFFLEGSSGQFQDISSSSYVERAHAMGLKVWGMVDNINSESNIYEALRHTGSRQTLIRGLVDAAVAVGLDGINVDFETLDEDTIPHFLEFLRELSIETHKYGLVLSVDDPVTSVYTEHYNRREQGRVVDYLIIMGYDEHYVNSESAGSVASLPWVEQGVIDAIAEVNPQRVINAIPFYTRVWWTQGNALYSSSMGMEESFELISQVNAEPWWNNDLGQLYTSWDDGGTKYEIWLEDEQSLREKALLVGKYGLAGIACWRLGSERDTVWQVLSAALHE